MDNRGSINDINGISRPTPRRSLVTPSRVSAERPQSQTSMASTPKKVTPPTEPLVPARPAAPLVTVETSAKNPSSSNKPWIALIIVMSIIAVVTLGYIAYILLSPEQ